MKTGAFVVELEHRVPGSPDLVFDYFTDPAKFRRWQGVEVDLDPRPGGRFDISTTPNVWTRGTYVEVERPTRVVVTWGFESHGVPLPRGLAEVPIASSTVEFTFAADGDGTVVRVRHSGLPTEEARWAHEQGWRIYLPRLGVVTGGDDPGEEPVVELATALFEREGRRLPLAD